MTDIIFVNPPYERVEEGFDFLKHIVNRSPSLGLLYLAGQTQALGYKTKIIECDIENLSPIQAAKRIISTQPKYLGITLFTVGVWPGSEIAKLVKQALPEITILVGGPHISSMGMETMERFPIFDIAVVGEGELILAGLLPMLDKNESIQNLNGIIYRTPEGLKATLPGSGYASLDDLPLPAWDLLPYFPKAFLPAVYDYPQYPVATILASRGCPFHCRFCDNSTFGSRIRYNSAEKVFQMLEHLQKKYGIKHVQFVDDLFVSNKKRVLELCDLIIERKFNMTWGCSGRADTVSEEVLQRMKEAGCWEIELGLETGSQELLIKMEKKLTLAKAETATKMIHKAGIRCKGLFMLGYPGETLETIEETKSFLKRIPMTTMNLSKFTPYPGSPIYRDLYKTGVRDADWERMNGMNFVWVPEGLSQEILDREYKEILKSFYSRPEVRRKYLYMSLTQPHHLYRLARFGIAFFRSRLMKNKKS